MFKHLTLRSIVVPAALTAGELEQALQTAPFTPCGPTATRSGGWVPPRGIANGALLEAVDGAWFLRLAIETKSVPASAVKKLVDAKAAQIEQERGYKPGRRERKELKDVALLELLPTAHPKRTDVQICIDRGAGLALLDTASASRADDAAHALISLPLPEGLLLQMLQTQHTPAGTMAAWLADTDTVPAHLTIDRDCTLKSADEMRSVVRYQRKALDTDEVKAHIAAGMRPQQLALTWAERVSFNLTADMTIKRLELLDVTMEGRADVEENEAFDADAAIFAGEARRLVPDLIDALGGKFAEAAAC